MPSPVSATDHTHHPIDHFRLNGDLALRRSVPQRIGDEIPQHLRHAIGISVNRNRPIDLRVQCEVTLFRHWQEITSRSIR